jgi:predicted ABC-type sugar transport system permease subunit
MNVFEQLVVADPCCLTRQNFNQHYPHSLNTFQQDSVSDIIKCLLAPLYHEKSSAMTASCGGAVSASRLRNVNAGGNVCTDLHGRQVRVAL